MQASLAFFEPITVPDPQFERAGFESPYSSHRVKRDGIEDRARHGGSGTERTPTTSTQGRTTRMKKPGSRGARAECVNLSNYRIKYRRNRRKKQVFLLRRPNAHRATRRVTCLSTPLPFAQRGHLHRLASLA